MPHQEAENGGHERHAVPASHAQEAGLGALLHPEDNGPGLDRTHGAAGPAGRGGCCGNTGELQEKKERAPLARAPPNKNVYYEEIKAKLN